MCRDARAQAVFGTLVAVALDLQPRDLQKVGIDGLIGGAGNAALGSARRNIAIGRRTGRSFGRFGGLCGADVSGAPGVGGVFAGGASTGKCRERQHGAVRRKAPAARAAHAGFGCALLT